MAAAETDDQLRRALEEKGIHVGPVTDTTRELYREKLRRLTGDTVGQGTRKGIAKGSPRQHLSHSQEVDGGKPTGLPPPPTANTSSSCVVYRLCAQFNNPLHIATDTAFLFPQGHVIYASRAVLAIACDTLSPFLYNQEEPYPVTVVTLTGVSCQVWVRGSELAADLKLKLSLKQGVPARELCLIHQQETLDDRLSLRQQQVSPGSSVHLVLVAADDPGQATYVGPVTTPALSITHMKLGIGLEQLWTSPPPSSSQISRIPLPAHLQHLIQVYDVSSEVMTVLLVYLYSGELPATLPECNRPLLLASCSILAEYFRVKELSMQCLQLLRACLTVESAVMLVKVAEALQYKDLHSACVGYLENHK